MPEWCPWKATVERVPRIPHLLNTDGQKAGNSLINGTYIPGVACEVWVTQISSNSCWNGVHGKPLFRDEWKASNSVINAKYTKGAACLGHSNQLQFMPEWFPWKASVERVLRIPHPLNTDGRKAGNSLINGTYIQHAACEVWDTQISSDSCQNDGWKAGNSVINAKYTKGAACEIWVTQISCNSCQNGVHGNPLLNVWKAGNSVINGTYTPGAASTVEGVPGMPHPLNADGRMAGNSVINAKYTKGAACEVWDTQISSDSCQNGFHGKPLLSRMVSMASQYWGGAGDAASTQCAWADGWQ
ncbi:hypothetical protein BKA82DRAFT_4020268 [Pisolithus tinctorius]|nr:hypothetical protein BKA82DRAFT_4020268 [Pisolithus tinctorius]